MNQAIGNLFRRGLSLLLALMMLLGTFPAMAETAAVSGEAEASRAASDSEIAITVQYTQLGTKKLISLPITMRDDWFEAPASTYNHDLARLSMGLTVSAFRRKDQTPDEGASIRDFLTQAGFSNLRSDWYDQQPTSDSITTMMGSKRIGDFTLVAVGVCGSGYGNEWMSNLTVGDDMLHEGFHLSAQKVEARIREYLEAQQFDTPVKLWISGFSRAAAVSNLTAADMTDSGLFEDVFAYTFATPRTTREPKAYANIFNIMGKNDVVPMIPLQDWGYGRHGTDLYTPSQEADTDYDRLALAASEASVELLGKYFRNNVELNHQLHTLIEYLLALLPEPADYKNGMQPVALSLWTDKSADNILASLLVILQSMRVSEERQTQLVNLIDYLTQVMNIYGNGNESATADGSWDPNATIGENAFLEHNPDTYISWIFADLTPEELYTDTSRWIHLVVSGPVDTTVYQDGHAISQVTKDNAKYTVEQGSTDPGAEMVKEDYTLISILRQGDQTIVTLPRDRDYMVELKTETDVEISYTLAEYTLGSIVPSIGTTRTLQTVGGQPCLMYLDDSDFDNRLLYDRDGNAFTILKSTVEQYSPELINRLESLNVFYLSLPDMLMLVALLMMFMLLVVIILVLSSIVRLIRHKRRKPAATIACTAIVLMIFFLWEEGARNYLSSILALKAAFKAMIALCILSLAMKGCLRTRTSLHMLMLLGILVACVADITLNLKPMVGLILFGVAHIIFCVAFFREHKPGKAQYILWGCLWAAVIAVLIVFRETAGKFLIPAMLYSGVLSAMVALSIRMPKTITLGAIIFAVSDAMLAINKVLGKDSARQFIALAVYYLAMMLLASATWQGYKTMDAEKDAELAARKAKKQARKAAAGRKES